MKKKLLSILLAVTMVLLILPFSALASGDSSLNGLKAVFVHHSTGGQWLADGYGNLGKTLATEGVYLSDVCYNWNATLNAGIGSYTDIGNWYTWFSDTTIQSNGIARRDNIMNSLYTRSAMDGSYGSYTRINPVNLSTENDIVIIKSCYPNSEITADIDGDPNVSAIFGKDVYSGRYSESNVRALYNSILTYMLAHPEKMFVVVTAPPRISSANADRARSLNNWLVNDWLNGNKNKNVYVWDYFNVLTGVNNHHYVVNDEVVHYTAEGSGNLNISAYHSGGDDHPNAAADQKATNEFVPCLEKFADNWLSWRSSTPQTPEADFTVSASSLSFAAKCVGYLSVAAQTVTVSNTGETTLELSLGNANNYVISNLSDTSLSVGESATFTVNPANNLTVGSYSSILSVTAGEQTKNVALSFTVNNHSYASAWTYDSNNHWHKCLGCSEISGVAAHVITQNGNVCSCLCGYSYTSNPPASENTYYVSPSGSNSLGNGSADAPWQTLEYASTQVQAAGDTIYLSAGTYNLASRVYIAPGVNLLGAGAENTTVFSSLNDGTWGECAAVNLVSNAVSEGGQYVAGIKFDGNNMTGDAALRIQNRNNVEVYNCEFYDFHYFAVGWNASDTGGITGDEPPAVFVEHGSFHDNITDNCAGSTDWFRGALLCGGIYDFEIYGNTMTENGRAKGTQGWPIKFWYYSGWMIDCKIHDNYLEKTDNSVWPFAIESMYEAGMEIYDNTIIGAVDINNTLYTATVNGTPYTYEYGLYVHDNIIGPDSSHLEVLPMGVILEERVEGVIIENNTIRNCSPALLLTPRAFGVQDVTFRYNACSGIAWKGPHNHAIRMMGSGTIPDAATMPYPTWKYGDSMLVENFEVYGNVFHCTQGNACFGVHMDSDTAAVWIGSNLIVEDNIFANFGFGTAYITNFTGMDSLSITGNKVLNSGSVWNGSALTTPIYVSPAVAPVNSSVANNTELSSVAEGVTYSVKNDRVLLLVKNGTSVPSPCKLVVSQHSAGVVTETIEIPVSFTSDGYFASIADFSYTQDLSYTYTVGLETANTVSVEAVALTPETKTLAQGGYFQLLHSIMPLNATNKNVSYTSSNTSVVTVTSEGFVTAVGTGTATITIKTADGNKTDTCVVTIPPLQCQHTNSYTVAAANATCTQPGYTAGTYCPDCTLWISGHQTIAATNHANAYNAGATAATCTAAGVSAGVYCPDCATWISGHQTIAAINHKNAYNVGATPAICTAAGVTAGVYCPDCTTWISGHQTIAAISHKNAYNVGATPATCTQAGIAAGVYCPDCQKWISGHQTVPKLGHADTDGNGACDVCGVSLGGSSDDNGSELSFFDKILAFFRKIAQWFQNLFS